MRSSAFLFTGVSIRFLRLATSGIREICTDRGSEVYKHHIATYGTQDKFGYKDFVPMFKAEHFDPGCLGRVVQEIRRKVRGAGGRAS